VNPFIAGVHRIADELEEVVRAVDVVGEIVRRLRKDALVVDLCHAA
jgi:hypothetical protein